MVQAFLEAAAVESEPRARALSASWEPSQDGGARLFRQLTRRGTEGYVVGTAELEESRAVVTLHKGDRKLFILLTLLDEWKVSGVQSNEAWSELFLAGQLEAVASLTDLAPADADVLGQATSWVDRLILKEGAVDGAPFNLRLMVQQAASIDPVPKDSRVFGNRAGVAFVFELPTGATGIWLVFERLADVWQLVKASEVLEVRDLLPG